ncbi:Parvovirus coat protein VP1-like protein [Lysinibacillus parviboronicapiens]|uniref:Parvovirus coat protein VP1-like protein n=1 Tax=Lysinibacillus parviboronicapiens TaxID=436516 RepID=UPI000D3919EF|nr:Parvovirus coat protein VP1-like protein [Lysinibacillus parviboronicapiens]
MKNRRSKLGFCYPGYRYCGPGCSGPGEPTNPVDACCKFHDECYSRYGRTKYCDQLFQSCLLPKINPHNKMGRDARLFYNIFEIRNKLY